MKHHRLTPWLLAAPVLLGALVFFVLPFFLILYYSVTYGVSGRFVGLQNYAEVFSSSAFRLAAGNTLRFLAVAVPLVLVLAFALALLLRRKFAGTGLFRTVLVFPLVVSVASIVMVVQVFLEERGVLNTLLAGLGLSAVDWLSGPAAFWVLVALYVWKNLGYLVVLLLAGLNMIPIELYESAAIEGATATQKLRHVTLPLMVPTLFFAFVMAVINSFKTYREAFLLGGKHPHQSIYLLQHFLNNNFENLSYQRLSVAAVSLFTLITALVAVFYAVQAKYGEAAQ